MESKHLASSNCQILKEDEVEIVDIETNEGRGDVLFGDMIWVKLHGQSWWPAQVCEMLCQDVMYDYLMVYFSAISLVLLKEPLCC